jgi:uncharacterized membrane protein
MRRQSESRLKAIRDHLATGLAVATTCGLALVLPWHGHFLADEARLYDGAIQVARTGWPAPFGPLVSGTAPPLVLPGGADFDLLAIPFLFGTSPWLGSFFVLAAAGIGLWVFDRTLRGLEFPPQTRLFAIALFGLSIWHARFADRIWNYHLFQLLSPVLFWIAIQLRKRQASAGLALAFGMASGIALQVNPTGMLAVVIGFAIAFEPTPEPTGRRPIRVLAIAAAGAVLVYLPYLVADAGHGLAVARALFGDRAARPALGREAWRSLLVFPSFASQSSPLSPERAHGIWAPALSFWVAVPLTLVGLVLRSPLRRVCLLALVLVPASFLLSGRDYTPQYAISLLPLYFVPAATALAFFWNRGRVGKIAAVGYLGAFAVLGLVLLNREYLRPPVDFPARPTIGAQLAVTDALLALHRPVRWIDDSMFDAPIIYEALARGARGTTLELSGPGPEAWLEKPAVASSLVVREKR